MSSSSSTPPSTYRLGNNGSAYKWIERELQRLDKGKTDKSHCTPTTSAINGKLKDLGREIHDLKQELDKDITGIQDVASEARKKAINLVCPNEARVNAMEKTVSLWSSWLIRGLATIIILLLTAGGGWVYSYVRLEETAKTASKAVDSFKGTVEHVRMEQKKQQETLERIERTNDIASNNLKDVLKQALAEALEKADEDS